jgi:hypothetical protein
MKQRQHGNQHRHPSREQRNTEHLENMLETIPAKIKEYGLMVMAIMGEGDKPEFAYSIGISELEGMPELLVVNLPGDIAHALIMDAFAKMKACGEPPEDGDILTGIGTGEGQNMEFVFKTVRPGNTMTNIAFGYFGGEVPVMQIAWPDQTGKFQWQDGFDASMRQDVAYAKRPHLKLV